MLKGANKKDATTIFCPTLAYPTVHKHISNNNSNHNNSNSSNSNNNKNRFSTVAWLDGQRTDTTLGHSRKGQSSIGREGTSLDHFFLSIGSLPYPTSVPHFRTPLPYPTSVTCGTLTSVTCGSTPF